MAVPLSLNGLTNTVKPVKQYGPCGLWSIQIFNAAVATTYIQCFDAAKPADVTLGTTVPTWVIAVPTVQSVVISPEQPVSFIAGLQIAATTTAGGAAAPATAVDVALVV
jgi:hypothetical protein